MIIKMVRSRWRSRANTLDQSDNSSLSLLTEMDNRGESRKIIFISKWKLSKEEVNFGNLKNLEIFTTNANGMELELILEDIQPDYIILTYCDFDTIRMVELYKNYKAQTSVKGFQFRQTKSNFVPVPGP